MADTGWTGLVCPMCAGGVVDGEVACRWCGAPLDHPDAVRALAASERLGELRRSYDRLMEEWGEAQAEQQQATARFRDAVHRGEAAHREDAPREAAPAPASSDPFAAPGTASAYAAPAAGSGVETTHAPDAGAPAAATPPPVAPPVAPRPVTHRRRMPSTPVLLGISGASLLIVSAVIFVAVTWSSFPLVPQVLIILGVAGAMGYTAVWLQRHRLPVTAGAVSAVATGFASVSMVAVERATGVLGPLTATVTLLAATAVSLLLGRLRMPGADVIGAAALVGAGFATVITAPAMLEMAAVNAVMASGIGVGLVLSVASRWWTEPLPRAIVRRSGVVSTVGSASLAAVIGLFWAGESPGHADAGAAVLVGVVGLAALLALSRMSPAATVSVAVVALGLNAMGGLGWWGAPWWLGVATAVVLWIATTVWRDRLAASMRRYVDVGLLVAAGMVAVVLMGVAAVAFVAVAGVVSDMRASGGMLGAAATGAVIAVWCLVLARRSLPRIPQWAAEAAGLVAGAATLWAGIAGIIPPFTPARAWLAFLLVAAGLALWASVPLWRVSQVRIAAGALAVAAGLVAVLAALLAGIDDGADLPLALVTVAAPLMAFVVAVRWHAPWLIPPTVLALMAVAAMTPAMAGSAEGALAAVVGAGLVATLAARWLWPAHRPWAETVSLSAAAVGVLHGGVVAAGRLGDAWIASDVSRGGETWALTLVIVALATAMGAVSQTLLRVRTPVVIGGTLLVAATLPAPASWIVAAAAGAKAMVICAWFPRIRELTRLSVRHAHVLTVGALLLAVAHPWPTAITAAVLALASIVALVRGTADGRPLSSALAPTGGAIAAAAASSALDIADEYVALAGAGVGWAIASLIFTRLSGSMVGVAVAGALITLVTPGIAGDALWSGLVLIVSAAGWLAIGWRRSHAFRVAAAVSAWCGTALVVGYVLIRVDEPASWAALMAVPVAALVAATGLLLPSTPSRHAARVLAAVTGVVGVIAGFTGVAHEQPGVWLMVATLAVPALAFAAVSLRWPRYGFSGLTLALISAAAAPVAARDLWAEALLTGLAVAVAATWAARLARLADAVWVEVATLSVAVLGALVAGGLGAAAPIDTWLTPTHMAWEPVLLGIAVATVLILSGARATRRYAPWVVTVGVLAAAAPLPAPWASITGLAAVWIALVWWLRWNRRAGFRLRSPHLVALALGALVLAGPDWWWIATAAATAAAVGMAIVARGAPVAGLPALPFGAWSGALAASAVVMALDGPDAAVAIAGATVGWGLAAGAVMFGRGTLTGAAIAGTALSITMPLVAAGPAVTEVAWSGTVLLISAVGWMALGLGRSRPLRWVAVGVAWLGTVVILLSARVAEPEAYVAIPAAFALVVGWRSLQGREAMSSLRALGPGLALVLVPSLVALVIEPSHLLRVLLLVAAIALLAGLGVLLSLRAPILAAASASVALAVTQVAVPDGVVPRGVSFAVVGVLLLALGATYERWKALR